MDAVATVADEARELIRRRNLDPDRDPGGMRRLVEDLVADYDERSLSGALPPIVDASATVKQVLDAVVGFGALQPYLDDPEVEEVWINEPGKIFIARRGIAELTTTILTDSAVRDLVERMLKSSGRRVDLSSPFVDATLPDGSRLHVVIPDITRRFWAVNIRKFVVRHAGGAGRAVPRRRRRLRSEHPGLGRDPGRQDDPAQLSGGRRTGPRTHHHVRGGVRAQGPRPRRGGVAVPSAEPGGHR